MSKREDLADDVWALLQRLGLHTSPGAGHLGLSSDNKYRTVCFGWARWLDGEVRIYGPKYFLYKDSRRRSRVLFSISELEAFLRDEVCS